MFFLGDRQNANNPLFSNLNIASSSKQIRSNEIIAKFAKLNNYKISYFEVHSKIINQKNQNSYLDKDVRDSINEYLKKYKNLHQEKFDNFDETDDLIDAFFENESNYFVLPILEQQYNIDEIQSILEEADKIYRFIKKVKYFNKYPVLVNLLIAVGNGTDIVFLVNDSNNSILKKYNINPKKVKVFDFNDQNILKIINSDSFKKILLSLADSSEHDLIQFNTTYDYFVFNDLCNEIVSILESSVEFEEEIDEEQIMNQISDEFENFAIFFRENEQKYFSTLYNNSPKFNLSEFIQKNEIELKNETNIYIQLPRFYKNHEIIIEWLDNQIKTNSNKLIWIVCENLSKMNLLKMAIKKYAKNNSLFFDGESLYSKKSINEYLKTNKNKQVFAYVTTLEDSHAKNWLEEVQYIVFDDYEIMDDKVVDKRLNYWLPEATMRSINGFHRIFNKKMLPSIEAVIYIGNQLVQDNDVLLKQNIKAQDLIKHDKLQVSSDKKYYLFEKSVNFTNSFKKEFSAMFYDDLVKSNLANFPKEFMLMNISKVFFHNDYNYPSEDKLILPLVFDKKTKNIKKRHIVKLQMPDLNSSNELVIAEKFLSICIGDDNHIYLDQINQKDLSSYINDSEYYDVFDRHLTSSEQKQFGKLVQLIFKCYKKDEEKKLHAKSLQTRLFYDAIIHDLYENMDNEFSTELQSETLF